VNLLYEVDTEYKTSNGSDGCRDNSRRQAGERRQNGGIGVVGSFYERYVDSKS
jgi:hypothetical protein